MVGLEVRLPSAHGPNHSGLPATLRGLRRCSDPSTRQITGIQYTAYRQKMTYPSSSKSFTATQVTAHSLVPSAMHTLLPFSKLLFIPKDPAQYPLFQETFPQSLWLPFLTSLHSVRGVPKSSEFTEEKDVKTRGREQSLEE